MPRKPRREVRNVDLVAIIRHQNRMLIAFAEIVAEFIEKPKTDTLSRARKLITRLESDSLTTAPAATSRVM